MNQPMPKVQKPERESVRQRKNSAPVTSQPERECVMFGRMGGFARRDNTTDAQRSKIASDAAKARWAKRTAAKTAALATTLDAE